MVEATLPFVRPEVGGLIRFQAATGCRPGEACLARPCDLDTSGPVWRYTPAHHKLAHRNKARVVMVGPRGQAVLREFWPADPAGYFFSPRRAVEALHAGRTAARKVPLYPSSAARVQRVAAPKRKPADRYRTAAYGHAIKKGVERANLRAERSAPAAGQHGPPLPVLPSWHPNQLRHTHGTLVRQRYGLEAAGAVLGHTKMSATEVYAERDGDLAAKVAAEIG